LRVSVNFASREYIIARKVYLSLLAGAVLLVGLFGYQYSIYASSQEQYSMLQAMLAKEDALEANIMDRYKKASEGVTRDEINKTISEADFANEVLIKKSFSWTQFLNRIEKLIPRGVGVNTISPDFKSLYVDISGSADNMDKLLEFIDTMTKSEYFEDLPPNFSSTRQVVDKDTGKTVEAFNIRIRYYPEGRGDKAEGES